MKPILEVKSVSKQYKIAHLSGGYLSLRERLSKGLFANNFKKEDFWALNDITFDVHPGDSLGIIGRNGAGKSTLLKILSKITPPTRGRIITRGRIASLLEVGTGFHPELTGRENIFFNGSLLGMRRHEIEKKFEEIVDFSGTERFLDTSLKHFSSGMQLRLAFSVAAFLEPEIMVIDEVLAVGDAEFQKKCIGKMEDVTNKGRTILFVSHDLNAISKLCQKTIVIKNGGLAFEGPSFEAIQNYQNDFKNAITYSAQKSNNEKPAYIKEIKVCNINGQEQGQFFYRDNVVLDFELGINDEKFRCDLFVMILNANKKRVFALESNLIKAKMKLIIESGLLVRGSYTIHAFINQPHIATIDEIVDVCNFEIIDNGSDMLKHGGFDYGDVFGRGKWILD
jgi:lipopolysaccharide transport system ATP-binding protein